METTDIPPEQLSERELFTEFVEILDRPTDSSKGYSEAQLRARRAALLAEIGERLEALEAARSLISKTESERERTQRRKQETNQEV